MANDKDERERQVEEASEPRENERYIETAKEDERESQNVPTTAPAVSGSQSVPVKGTIKWEKKRTSSRVTKTPDRLGYNIMICKVEVTSSEEQENLLSVYEIANPKKAARKQPNI